MAFCQVADIHDLSWHQTRLVAWALSIAVGLVVACIGWRRDALAPNARAAWRGLGAALFAVPAWLLVLFTAPDMIKTFCAQGNLNLVIPPGQTAPTLPVRILSDQYLYTLVGNLGYVGAGAMAYAQGVAPGWWKSGRLAPLAAAVRPLLPMGKRTEGASLRLGIAAFPVLALVNVGLLWLTTGSAADTGDDSSVFAKSTVFHIVMISLAAAFAEELVFRGVMQQSVARIFGGPRPGPIAVGAAVLVQAIPFAYGHAAYVNLQHLLFAFLFAVAMGIVAQLVGIWCAIALHFLIDFFALGLQVTSPDWTHYTAAVVVGAAVLAVAVREYARGAKGWRAKQQAG